MNIIKYSKTICTLGILGIFSLASCVKHEVVPPPVNTVKLQVFFTGNINGTDVEYTDDVDGFNGETSDIQVVQTSPLLSQISYYCDMTSNLIDRSIRVGIGSIYWDAGAVDRPQVTDFNTFMTNLLEQPAIPYTQGAIDGFEVIYRDNFGNTWTSDENSVNTQTVEFTSIDNQQDDTGDYSKFSVNFSCYLYRTVETSPTIVRDSIRISGAEFKGWFKR